MGKGKPFFTVEDLKASFNLFCCVYGIGTLGMPGNFSRAGPVIATLALLFMAFANVYSSVCISKTMLLAPRSVKTYGDLGEWCMGKTGRYLTVIAQMGNCLLVPCAFLVLGGTLLDDLFPGAFSPKTWIILMAILVTPVCLIPTLKEGAGVALAGCLGTILGDVLGVALLLHGMSGHPSVPSPDLGFKQVATAFGNLSLAYGAGIVIPALQRQHSDPTRMPRVVFVTVTFISVLFLCLASTGYSAVGCQISGNLLFSIYPDATTGLTPLGFTVDKGLVVLAFLGMQLHITIAFNVIIAPAFYILERMLLGMHPIKPIDDIESVAYEAAETPGDGIKTRASKGSVVSMADIAKENDDEDAELLEYKGHALKYIPMRIAVVVVLVIASVLFRDHFSDLTDFVGASAITLSCIVLPIIFYLKKCWEAIPMYEKIPGVIVIVVCLFFGCYVTYLSGKQLFNPDDTSPDDPVFPFCAPEHEYEIYYIKDNSTRF